MSCARCSGPPGSRRTCRRLCDRCYCWARRSPDRLADYPRKTRAAADVLEDFGIVRARMPTATRTELAEAIGMGRAALDRALVRAHRRGIRT